MNSTMKYEIKVPGSTSNLGPGFDSIGLAVSRYLTLDVEYSENWEFIPLSEELKNIPTGTENLMYKVCSDIAQNYQKRLPSCRVKVTSDIPLARGLGSSAAAIIAAIELTNEICDLKLTKEQKLAIACEYEGHPDNVSPSLYGGLVIGCQREHENVDIVHVQELDLDIVVVIPPYEIKTKDARKVLPTHLEYSTAVEASAISNVLVASLLTKQYEKMGKMMDLDLFHHPYRKSLIPEFGQIVSMAKESGAFGVAISGAGPTMICFVEKGLGGNVKQILTEAFTHSQVEMVTVEKEGSSVKKLSLQS